MIKTALSYRKSFLFFFAATLSVILSWWISSRETVINPDAICYLYSAQEIGISGLTAAMNLCGQAKWPFYSFLIHEFVKFSHFSYLVSAFVLNGFFTCLSVIFFILIVKELGGTKRVLWLAALTILLSHQFNSVREYIIRDHGFWAFYLASVFFLLRFFSQPSWLNACAFSFSLMIATLFRIEGAFFLLGLPFLSWFCFQQRVRQRMYFFFQLNLPTLIISAVFGVWVLTQKQTLDQLGRLPELLRYLLHGILLISTRFQDTKVALLHQKVLVFSSANEIGFILLIFYAVWYTLSVISNLSFIYSFLVVFAWCKRLAPFTFTASLVLFGYLFINILVTSGFLVERLFISKRYLIALSLICMLWVPFAFDYFLQSPTLRNRLAVIAIAFFIFISALGGIFDFGYSKAYIREAGEWLAKNVPLEASLYANDYQLMYYSQHFGKKMFANLHEQVNLDIIAHDRCKHYDYIALRLDKKKAEQTKILLQERQLIPTQIFKNKRGDQVIIFRSKL